ncbi:F0F1 ATP synthase subunit delta [Rhizomonospora bruguierae]|uniref:F0F1 ATP synthase subunit delta n=1 Tax=Rhizomonospora bruguierae TaxID=1581705 RepID=UPI001BCE8F6B|nr:F0F1 ATP synthase subunit delta [Micromonospora sp. NBRC 107566]
MPGGAGREAYAAAAERLNEVLGRADAATVGTAADEILAAAVMLGREPRLRRALVDPSRAADERAGLLRTLLSGKVSDTAVELLATLVSGRFSAPSELLDAAERLGVEALLAGADSVGELAEVEDELFRFGHVADANPALAGALGDSTTPVDQRMTLVRELLEGKALPVTVRLVQVALAGFGGRSVTGGLSRLVELAAERRDRQIAYVTVAAPISDGDEQRLGAKLSELYRREVSVKVSVEPRVLGGMSVRVGSDLYDGTILRRLNETRHALTGR